jgi:hypothetical protein
MKRGLLRVVLALLLVLTVASKAAQPPDGIGRNELIARVMEVLAQHRLAGQPDLVPARSVIPVAVRFEAPGCDRPIEVLPIHINFQEAPVFDVVLGAGYVRLFAYLDRTWLVESPWGMRLTWLKHKLLSLIGLGRFVTITTGLLVASPPGCRAADTIDWSRVWDRSTTGRP